MSASASPSTLKPARRRLPFTLYVLAGLMLFKALIIVAVVAGATLESLRPILGLTTGPELTRMFQQSPAFGPLLLAFAGLVILSVIGMLSRRRTGWLLAMVITGLFVAIDIYGYLNSNANHLWMVLNIVTVFYLNQRDVREAVGAAEPIEAVQAAPAP
jgi:uncharacterized membrane protein